VVGDLVLRRVVTRWARVVLPGVSPSTSWGRELGWGEMGWHLGVEVGLPEPGIPDIPITRRRLVEARRNRNEGSMAVFYAFVDEGCGLQSRWLSGVFWSLFQAFSTRRETWSSMIT